MKRLIALIALAMLFAPAKLRSQAPQGVRQYAVTAPGSDLAIGNIGTGIAYHKLIWSVSGSATTCQVKLEQSASGVGGWSDLIAAQTCTSNGASTVVNVVANYVRITFTVLSGGGTVTATWNGYTSNPAGGASGTLQSVGLAMPVDLFSVAGSPVSGVSGSFTVAKQPQSPNTVFAGPLSSTGSFQVVQSATGISNNAVTTAVSFAANTVAGNAIMVFVGAYNGIAATPTDTQGNTYVRASTDFGSAEFYIVCAGVGGADTVTVSFGGAAGSANIVHIAEVSGVLASGCIDSGSNNVSLGSTPSVATPAGATATDMLIAVFCDCRSGTAAWTVGAGFQQFAKTNSVAAGSSVISEYKTSTIASGSGAQTATAVGVPADLLYGSVALIKLNSTPTAPGFRVLGQNDITLDRVGSPAGTTAFSMLTNNLYLNASTNALNFPLVINNIDPGNAVSTGIAFGNSNGASQGYIALNSNSFGPGQSFRFVSRAGPIIFWVGAAGTTAVMAMDQSGNIGIGNQSGPTSDGLYVNNVGLIARYNNVNTVSTGIPSIIATVGSNSLTADVASSTLYAVPGTLGGTHRITGFIGVVTPAGTSSTLPTVTITCTDLLGSGVQVFTPTVSYSAGGASGNTAASAGYFSMMCNAKTSTNILYQTSGYASVPANAMTFQLQIRVERF